MAIEQKIFFALERMGEAIRSQKWEMAKTHRISPLQLDLLLFIDSHRPEFRKPARLAKEFMVTKPTITDAIRALVEKDLLIRERDKNDSRSTFLHLSATGEKMVAALEDYHRPMLEIMKEFSGQENHSFYKKLLGFLKKMQEAQLISPTRMCFNCRHYQGDEKKQHYCKLLEEKLSMDQLRIDCPEHETPFV